MSNRYEFVTHWHVRGDVREVYLLISDPLDYPRWWPSVYLETSLVAAGDEHGRGARVRYFTKGWLPYTLHWESCATELDPPQRVVIRATGDFNGRGEWRLEQRSDFVDATFHWELTADKPLLRYLSSVLKPVFAANHLWAMAQGEKSLRIELARRQASGIEELRTIPRPPGPNRTSGLWLSVGAAAIIFGMITAFRRANRVGNHPTRTKTP
jgi:hypothetical protein